MVAGNRASSLNAGTTIDSDFVASENTDGAGTCSQEPIASPGALVRHTHCAPALPGERRAAVLHLFERGGVLEQLLGGPADRLGVQPRKPLPRICKREQRRRYLRTGKES